MKSSTQVFASLVAALATLSQSAIATPRHVSPQHSIYWQHSPLSASSQATITDSSKGSAVSKSFRVADRAVVIDADAISVGSKNRTTILKCSESKPCIEDLLVIDSYKEIFSSDGKIKAASIVMYNTSYAPTAIEVYNSKGEFKSVDFVDGKKGGFKDLGDFLKTAASGIVEPFACVIGKGYQQCLNDLKNGKYEITKAEKQLKLQSGDVIRISRGSEPARFYAHALQGLDMVDSLISSSEIVKKDPITLKKNFSTELKRKIIEGYIKKKMNDKYTWGMLLKEFGYETNKKAIGNNLDLFNSSLEVARNIPEDFRKAIIDGTVASKVAGDGLSLLIESASKKASIFLDSTLLLSQLTNIYVRSSSSEAAYKNPYPFVIAYEKPIKDKTPRVTASKPVAAKPNKQSNTALLKSLFSNLSDDVLKNKCDVKQIDLNKDGKDEIFIRTTEAASCGGNGRCSFTIERRQENRYQTILSGITTSPAFAVLGSQTNGWRDIATRSYLGKEFWSVWKFDGKEYQVVGQRGIDSISNGNIVKSKPCSEVLSSVAIPTQGTQSNSNLALSIDEKVRLIPVKTALIMTNTAIKSGDISKARHYFDMFNTVWSSVELMIKSKTGNNYRKIEEGIDIAKTAMEPTPPDKWKAMEGLTTAIKAISIVKGDL